MHARYLVGIDLGTVNSALAAADLLRGGDLAPQGAPGKVAASPRSIDLVEAVEAWLIPQLVAPGEVAPRTLLPSSLYLPGPELPEEQRRLPWGVPADVVGTLAREQGARVPGRLVVSAKSWLAHPRADRRAPILPWGAPEGVPRVSPVTASARYLDHMRLAWNAAHPGAPLEEQELVLAVPASFDEVARELTLEAAGAAGLPRATLIEEPAAAFHDWASRHRADLAAALGGESALVLVVDVGGGTTDLTLVRAEVRDGRPSFTRLAVGDHLLLGGDNMDLALARLAESRLSEEAGSARRRGEGVARAIPTRLEPARFGLLVLACRAAKERLLAADAPPSAPVAVAGRGSRLLAGAVSASLGRDEVRALVLDGFFPAVAPGDRPRRGARTAGLAELGLPYEPDPAITRHVAAFLAANAEDGAALARPDAILVNGGVFTPPDVRGRLAEAVSGLFPGAPPVRLLAGPSLDLAVARGAAASALARRGIGQRIGGGSPRAFYVGIATPSGEQALCVVPRHLEEGSRVSVPRPFTLALHRPVRFPLFASVRPRLERPGDVVPVSEDLTPLAPLEAVLRGEGQGRAVAADVPVRLEAALTEIGTLELWCVATDRDARWKLEFGLRGTSGDGSGPRGAVGPAPRKLGDATALVEAFYGRKAAVDRREVKGLFRALEKVLGPRDTWPTAVVRALWAALHAGAARRRRSPDHERVWAQLTGFALRPGFGAPLDAWRAAETFAVFGEGLQYQSDPHAWQAWWVLWRRIAGGLEPGAQERIFDAVAPFVARRDPRKPPPRVPGVKPEAFDELVRLAGSLERVPPDRKLALGEALLDRIAAEGPSAHALWALGRLGARVPFHGSVHQVVPAGAAEEWIRRLLALEVARAPLAFPLAQLARRSGDRARDVPGDLRAEVAALLRRAGAAPEAVHAVEEVAETSEEGEQRIFGESLPPGLTLGADPVNEPASEPEPEGRPGSLTEGHPPGA